MVSYIHEQEAYWKQYLKETLVFVKDIIEEIDEKYVAIDFDNKLDRANCFAVRASNLTIGLIFLLDEFSYRKREIFMKWIDYVIHYL